jgi:hypothetical protein
LPAVHPSAAAGEAPPTTPCLQELDRRRLEAIESERTRLVEHTAELVVRRRTLTARSAQSTGRLREETDAQRREQLRLRLGELDYALASLDERIVRECVTAQSRAVCQDEYLRRCCARYARTVLRRHAGASELTQQGWPTLGALPGWVTDPSPTAALLPSVGGPDGPRNPDNPGDPHNPFAPADRPTDAVGPTSEPSLSRAGAR